MPIEWTSTGPIYTGVGGVDPMFMQGYVAPGYRMNPMTGMSPINQMHQQMAQQAYQQQMQNRHYSSNVARDPSGRVLERGTPVPRGPQIPRGMNQSAPYPMNQPQTSFSQTRLPAQVNNFGPIDLSKFNIPGFNPTDPMNYNNQEFGSMPIPNVEKIPDMSFRNMSMPQTRPSAYQKTLRPRPGSWEDKLYKALGI